MIIKIFLLSFLLSAVAYSQNLKGTVYGMNDNKKEPLDGAVLKWINTTKGTFTNLKGEFEISKTGIEDKRLIVIFTGYKKDTVEIGEKDFIEIIIRPAVTTDVIQVEDKIKSTFFGNYTVKTEVITSQELVKEACCDLAGCFGRNSSVEVAVTDIITDSKELKILGLDGVYTQILIDNMPLITGLNMKYGITGIPGTLIDKITVSKGSNSVLHGYESISGIMNVILKDYDNTDRFMFNAFVNSMYESQYNLNATHKYKNWSTFISGHSVQKSHHIDDNKDGFYDNPLVTRYMLYNKWKLIDRNKKNEFNIAGRFLKEERVGGQIHFDIDKDEGSNTIYGQTVRINSAEGYSRFSHKFGNKSELRMYISGFYYNQKSYYGSTKYNAKQSNFTLFGFYEFEPLVKNFLKLGGSYKYNKINEEIVFGSYTTRTYAGNYLKKESIPGFFAEGSANFLDNKASLMAGIRFDYHNEHKLIITPRALFRYQPQKTTVFRVSGGTGFRTANVFTENSNILASSRDILFSETLKPEKIINFGTDIIQYFDLGFAGGSLNVDFYHTQFLNKIIPDYDTSPSKVIFSNLNGTAYSNAFQSEISLTILRNTELKLAYKFLDVKYEKNGQMVEQPFVAKHRMLATFSYAPQNNSWGINAGVQWYGKQRLPSTQSNPIQYQRPEVSTPYTIINLQVNKNFRLIEVYAGAENLFNFKQHNPIISADNPFGPYFDTSFIWGPTKGREIYAGVRFIIGRKTE